MGGKRGRQTFYNTMLTIVTAIFRSLPTSVRCSPLSSVLPRGKEGVSWQLGSLAKAKHPISKCIFWAWNKEKENGLPGAYYACTCMHMHAHACTCMHNAGSMKESQISWPSPL